MKNSFERIDPYIEQMNTEVFEALSKSGSLKAFRDAMKNRAEHAAREIVRVNDDNLLHGIRGQISICYELADGAQAALDALEASANAEDAKGIRQDTPYEL